MTKKITNSEIGVRGLRQRCHSFRQSLLKRYLKFEPKECLFSARTLFLRGMTRGGGNPGQKMSKYDMREEVKSLNFLLTYFLDSHTL